MNRKWKLTAGAAAVAAAFPGVASASLITSQMGAALQLMSPMLLQVGAVALLASLAPRIMKKLYILAVAGPDAKPLEIDPGMVPMAHDDGRDYSIPRRSESWIDAMPASDRPLDAFGGFELDYSMPAGTGRSDDVDGWERIAASWDTDAERECPHCGNATTISPCVHCGEDVE